jgi:hypothetical protein
MLCSLARGFGWTEEGFFAVLRECDVIPRNAILIAQLDSFQRRFSGKIEKVTASQNDGAKQQQMQIFRVAVATLNESGAAPRDRKRKAKRQKPEAKRDPSSRRNPLRSLGMTAKEQSNSGRAKQQQKSRATAEEQSNSRWRAESPPLRLRYCPREEGAAPSGFFPPL